MKYPIDTVYRFGNGFIKIIKFYNDGRKNKYVISRCNIFGENVDSKEYVWTEDGLERECLLSAEEYCLSEIEYYSEKIEKFKSKIDKIREKVKELEHAKGLHNRD